MKLLKDERISLEEGEVKLTMHPVTTSQQARLVELATVHGVAARIDLSNYCLRTCIETLRINDEAFEPKELADCANISDPATLSVMVKIGGMVTNAAFAKDEDLKK